MEVTKSYNAFLKYADYNEYKYYFKPYGSREINEEIYNTALGYLHMDPIKKNKYTEGFRILFHHLYNDHVFSSMNIPKSCNYISYMLRNKVDKDKSLLYDEDIFKKFEQFVDKYKEARSLKSQSCENNMTLLDSNIFEQMHSLYNLYDRYFVFAPTTKYSIPKMACGEFEYFIRLYNAFIKDKNPTNEHYYKVLKDFEDRISKTVSVNIDNCHGFNLNLTLLKPYPLEKVVQPKVLEGERHPQTGLAVMQSGSSKLNQVALPDAAAKTHQFQASLTELPGNNENHETTRFGERVTLVNVEKEQEPPRVLQDYRTNEVRGVEDEPRVEEPQELLEPRTRQRLSLNYEDFTTRQPSPYPEYLNPQDLSKEAARDSPTIMGSITSVLKEVDPVPVVGVSGGMGALFLLFRYTPVGAFFRGGRGRAHRIPRSFNGQFLGGFPGYEEYDGGYIGYSPMNMNPLAE